MIQPVNFYSLLFVLQVSKCVCGWVLHECQNQFVQRLCNQTSASFQKACVVLQSSLLLINFAVLSHSLESLLSIGVSTNEMFLCLRSSMPVCVCVSWMCKPICAVVQRFYIVTRVFCSCCLLKGMYEITRCVNKPNVWVQASECVFYVQTNLCRILMLWKPKLGPLCS